MRLSGGDNHNLIIQNKLKNARGYVKKSEKSCLMGEFVEEIPEITA